MVYRVICNLNLNDPPNWKTLISKFATDQLSGISYKCISWVFCLFVFVFVVIIIIIFVVVKMFMLHYRFSLVLLLYLLLLGINALRTTPFEADRIRMF